MLMSVVHSILLRTFGRPKGILGRVGGIIMARTNQKCAAWVIDLLDIQPHDRVPVSYTHLTLPTKA